MVAKGGRQVAAWQSFRGLQRKLTFGLKRDTVPMSNIHTSLGERQVQI